MRLSVFFSALHTLSANFAPALSALIFLNSTHSQREIAFIACCALDTCCSINKSTSEGISLCPPAALCKKAFQFFRCDIQYWMETTDEAILRLKTLDSPQNLASKESRRWKTNHPGWNILTLFLATWQDNRTCHPFVHTFSSRFCELITNMGKKEGEWMRLWDNVRAMEYYCASNFLMFFLEKYFMLSIFIDCSTKSIFVYHLSVVER